MLEKDEAIKNIETRLSEQLESALSRRKDLVDELTARGKFASTLMNHSSIVDYALDLGQIKLVCHQNAESARDYFALALAAELKPTFQEVANSIEESMKGNRLWDQGLMSIGDQLKAVLCYLLLGRQADAFVEYQAIHNPSLFIEADAVRHLPVFTRHLILTCMGLYQEIHAETYELCRDLKMSSPLFGYHSALIALANADADQFMQEIATCYKRYVAREKSKKSNYSWGYGFGAHLCFDVVGTSLYRLANARGLSFPLPDERYYPAQFWRDSVE